MAWCERDGVLRGCPPPRFREFARSRDYKCNIPSAANPRRCARSVNAFERLTRRVGNCCLTALGRRRSLPGLKNRSPSSVPPPLKGGSGMSRPVSRVQRPADQARFVTGNSCRGTLAGIPSTPVRGHEKSPHRGALTRTPTGDRPQKVWTAMSSSKRAALSPRRGHSLAPMTREQLLAKAASAEEGLAARLRWARERAGLSVRAAARRSGVAESTIRRAERTGI